MKAVQEVHFRRADDHPYFRSIGDAEAHGIISYFRKTPSSIICPHFWELRWAYGCPYDCAYCYLRGTFRGKKNPRYPISIDRVLTALERAFQNIAEPTVFNSGELADSLMNPEMMRVIADKFEEQAKHKLLLLTKSDNVRCLVERPRRNTIVSFSVNTPGVWKRWENLTPPPKKRIEAARNVQEVGYEVRFRIDPIFPIEEWRKQSEDLIYLLLSELPRNPERITLGTPRGLRKTLLCSDDRSWAEGLTENSGWGKKLPTELRKEVYLFFYDKLCQLGFDRSKIAICKETASMWKSLGLEPTRCKCNCIW